MNTKLTLVLEKEVIQKAKDYAKQTNDSLSNIIENYLKALTNEDIKKKTVKASPIVKSLRGSFKLPKDFDYKEELIKAIEKKHL
ncbi:DUF6364 family protein [Flavobacterium sp.]|uniref:DUF6364 family protein n=1 Tax=Flavobacterium sp. TaxID=239 RepID=UPI0026345862|nr:DUF6364 family protein [Flavobacterium sp.]